MVRSQPAATLIMAVGALAGAATSATLAAIEPLAAAENADRPAPPDGFVEAISRFKAAMAVSAATSATLAAIEPLAAAENADRPAPSDGFVEATSRFKAAMAVSADELFMVLEVPPPSPPNPERAHAQTVSDVARTGARTGSPELVADVQRGLIRLGYAPGRVDSLTGPQTRAAIRAFQRDAGLAVDGEPSAVLLARLHAAGMRTDEGAVSKREREGPDRDADRASGQPRVLTDTEDLLRGPLVITGDAALTAIVEQRGLDRPSR